MVVVYLLFRTKALTVMLELALPVCKGKFPYKYAEVMSWMAPTSSARRDLGDERVQELAKQLPEKVKALLDKMPKGDGGSISETLMHTAVCFNEFHERWHAARDIIKRDEMAKKRRTGELDEAAGAAHLGNQRWAEDAELAFKTVLPDMADIVEQADIIQAAKTQVTQFESDNE